MQTKKWQDFCTAHPSMQVRVWSAGAQLDAALCIHIARDLWYVLAEWLHAVFENGVREELHVDIKGATTIW